jgi:hypothetical protein
LPFFQFWALSGMSKLPHRMKKQRDRINFFMGKANLMAIIEVLYARQHGNAHLK